MIVNISNHKGTASNSENSEFVFASVHIGGIALMFYGFFIAVAYGRIAGLWMALLGLVVFRVVREVYSRYLITRALHGHAVAEFMDQEAMSFDPSTPLSEIMRRVREDKLVFPVARSSDHEFLGLVDVRSSKDFPAHEWRTHQIAEITKPCERDLVMAPEDDAEIALARMQNLGLREILVVKSGRLLGVLSLSSLVTRIQNRFGLPSSDLQAAT